jgi:hypothetical protein
MKQMFYNVMNNVYVVFGCMDELDVRVSRHQNSTGFAHPTWMAWLLLTWQQ